MIQIEKYLADYIQCTFMVSILDIFLNVADDRRLYCNYGNRLGACKTLSDSNQTAILTARRVELGPWD